MLRFLLDTNIVIDVDPDPSTVWREGHHISIITNFLESLVQPIRQVIEDMPAFYPVPLEAQHQRVEIIIWPLAPLPVQGAFKRAIAAMPDIGQDEDFVRKQDLGRGETEWNT